MHPDQQSLRHTLALYAAIHFSFLAGCENPSIPHDKSQCRRAALLPCYGAGLPPATDSESLAFCLPFRRLRAELHAGYGSALTRFVYDEDRLVEIVTECDADTQDGLFRIQRTGDGVSRDGWAMDTYAPIESEPGFLATYSWEFELDADGRLSSGSYVRAEQSEPISEYVATYSADGKLAAIVRNSGTGLAGSVSTTTFSYRWSADLLVGIESLQTSSDETSMNAVTYEYAEGHPVRARGDDFEMTHVWDGDLLMETHSSDLDSGARTVRNTYTDGRLARQTIEAADGELLGELSFAYDEAGRTTSIEVVGYEPTPSRD